MKKITVGIGINLDNEQPTTCINAILKSKNKPPIKPEDLLIRILEEFERLILELEKKGWKDAIENEFYKVWGE